MMTLSMPLSIATSVPFLNCIICQAWRLSAWPRGSITIELGAALGRLLEEGRGDRMVLGRVGADDDDDVGVLALVEGRGHRGRADAFEQRRHRRGVAEPRAVVDVVGAEAGAHQLLEQIGLFVRALGRAEAGERVAGRRGRGFSSGREAARSSASSQVASRKCVHGFDGSTRSSARFGDAVLADHRLASGAAGW